MSARAFRRSVSTAILVLAAILLASAGSFASVDAASSCKKVSGSVTLQAVNDATCASPVGLCAAGVFKGDIKGASSFIATALIPSSDTPTTSVVFATGDNTIQSDRGTLLTKDAISLATSGDGEFAEVDTIVGGTGMYQGVTGRLLATGYFSGSSGAASYTGQVCYP